MMSAMLSTLATVKNWPGRPMGVSHKILFNSAYTAVYFGMVRDLRRRNPDGGEWLFVDKGQAGGKYMEMTDTQANISKDEYNTLKAHADKEWVNKVFTAMLATKINWWQANHHYGQGGPSPFMRKVLEMLYPNSDPEEYADATYCAGHWISTHFALKVLGIETGRITTALTEEAETTSKCLQVTDDFKIRMQGMPAGVAKHALCHAFLKKYAAIPVITMVPRPADLKTCFAEVERLYEQTKDFLRYGG